MSAGPHTAVLLARAADALYAATGEKVEGQAWHFAMSADWWRAMARYIDQRTNPLLALENVKVRAIRPDVRWWYGFLLVEEPALPPQSFILRRSICPGPPAQWRCRCHGYLDYHGQWRPFPPPPAMPNGGLATFDQLHGTWHAQHYEATTEEWSGMPHRHYVLPLVVPPFAELPGHVNCKCDPGEY